MIEAKKLTKKFKNNCALNSINLEVADGEIFGLIGINGAGKSTLLRLIAGIYIPDEGAVLVDSKPVYDNPEIKKDIFFISDDPYYYPHGTALDMAEYYRSIYKTFDTGLFEKLMSGFSLDINGRIQTFSKGMKRQMFICLGISSGTRYLLLDESFDGLDPVAREAVKRIFAVQMADRGLSVVIASHSLRELEDICDHIGLLHNGGVLLSRDLTDMKISMQKVQCVFENEDEMGIVLSSLNVLAHDIRGRLHTITIRNTREEVEFGFAKAKTIFFEILPLSLEELFISETEAVGYDIKNKILD